MPEPLCKGQGDGASVFDRERGAPRPGAGGWRRSWSTDKLTERSLERALCARLQGPLTPLPKDNGDRSCKQLPASLSATREDPFEAAGSLCLPCTVQLSCTPEEERNTGGKECGTRLPLGLARSCIRESRFRMPGAMKEPRRWGQIARVDGTRFETVPRKKLAGRTMVRVKFSCSLY